MIGSPLFQVRKKKPVVAGLMLVSLVDIFTFFIFFLLINTGESAKIQNARYVALPNSISNIVPVNKLIVFIDANEVWLDDKPVAHVADILKAPEKLIDSLTSALTSRKEVLGELSEYEKVNGLSITIMGDKSVSYILLKSVMVTCQGSNYRNLSLAVNHIMPTRFSSPDALKDAVDSSATKVGG